MSKKKKTVAGSQKPVAGSETKRAEAGPASQPATGYGLPATNEETTITLEAGGKSVTLGAKAFDAACQKVVERFDRLRRDTPNIIAPAVEPTETGTETVGVAGAKLREIAQGLINEVREHRHLAEARVLLLVAEKPAVAKALEAGAVKAIGKAAKARSLDRLLSSVRINSQEPVAGSQEKQTDAPGGLPPPPAPGSRLPATHYERADFVVRLSGDWLSAIRWPAEPGSDKLAAALIDHELCHCGAKIAGEFVEPDELTATVEELGDDHIETCADVTREGKKGKKVLVRYYSRTEAGAYRWVMRRHDVEEFAGVIQRHGAWARQLRKLVDVLVEREDLPLLRAARQDVRAEGAEDEGQEVA